MRRPLLLGLLSLAGACALSPIRHGGPREARWIGTRAPELTGAPLIGSGPHSLAGARGRVVIVEFWATYCTPCERSFPRYQKLIDRFGEDVAVIAISLDDPEDVGRGALVDFAERTGARFPIVWDRDQTMKAAYDPPALPTSFVIDRDGNIVHVHIMYEPGDADRIDREVEELLQRAPANASGASEDAAVRLVQNDAPWQEPSSVRPTSPQSRLRP